jgi:hypothetical protein
MASSIGTNPLGRFLLRQRPLCKINPLRQLGDFLTELADLIPHLIQGVGVGWRRDAGADPLGQGSRKWCEHPKPAPENEEDEKKIL